MSKPIYTRAQALPDTLTRRLVILDGAMGTMIQRFKLDEAQYRGAGLPADDANAQRFMQWHKDVKGNNELLSLTRPDVISAIHEKYLAAGADLIETNTFGATTVAQADYDMAELARDMNLASARLARQACDKFSTPDHPRYVAGALPDLPLASDSADLVLCSHLLFTYADRLDMADHVDAIVEMARVAPEVRIYPLVDHAGNPLPELVRSVIARLKKSRLTCEIEPVIQPFQLAATTRLVVRRTSNWRP